MNISEKKEAVRQVIIKAVPSVMDLMFGCKIAINTSMLGVDDSGIIPKDDISYLYVLYYDKGGSSFNGEDTEYYGDVLIAHSEEWTRTFEWGEGSDDNVPKFEIIGRPITLFDTSKVVKDKHTLIDIWTEGSLDDQSDKTIAWIYEDML